MSSGNTVVISWQGRSVEAFVPAPLPTGAVELPERVVRATERAAASLLRVDDRLIHRFEALARLLLRAEGVASSNIEGVRAPAALVAVAELDPGAVDNTTAWVADNLAVVDASLAHARSEAVLTADDLHRWHARLMTHGRLPDGMVGRFREVQNWIGGPSPREAAYVPPPPDHVGRLMDDLLRFANTSAGRPRHPGRGRPRPVRGDPSLRRRQRAPRTGPHRVGVGPARPGGHAAAGERGDRPGHGRLPLGAHPVAPGRRRRMGGLGGRGHPPVGGAGDRPGGPRRRPRPPAGRCSSPTCGPTPPPAGWST